MKILVFAHQLEVGGTQTNAIELAAALRDVHGHDVALFATPGPMIKLVQQKGLRYLPAPEAYVHPSPARMRALRAAVRQERPDVIHAWDWWQCLDAYYSEHLIKRFPLVVSDMMMTLTRLLPKSLPTTFGTPEVVDQARTAGWRCAKLLLPPVDVHLNAPDAVNPRPFRERYGIQDGDILLVSISRLDTSMKAESLHRTVAAVRSLGRELPIRYVMVGDGLGRPELERMAAEVNAALGRVAIVLPGAMLDPRPAYAAADIVVGMGGSALRAMAFGKPVIVVGKEGFSLPFNPQTEPTFYCQGMYGTGDGDPGDARHIANIRSLADHREQLRGLGEFARQFVVKHFAMETVSARLAEVCRAAATEEPRFCVSAADGFRTAAVCLRERRVVSYRFWERGGRSKAPTVTRSELMQSVLKKAGRS